MPNLFIVGAMKSGTTTLHQILSEHPDVFMSKIKEPHYFAFEGKRPHFQGPDDERIASLMMLDDQDKYADLFSGRKEKLQGESSAMYLFYSESAKRIKEFNPHSKIIIMLRDPVDRAYSAYSHLIRDQREKLSFREALGLEKQRIEENYVPLWYYTEAGKYHKQVMAFYDAFPSEQIAVIDYEDFRVNYDKTIEQICDFLNISNDFDSNSIVLNKSGIPKNKFLHSFLKRKNPIKTLVKKMLPSGFAERVKTYFFNLNLDKIEPLNDDFKSSLYRTYFKEDIDSLEKLLNRSFIHWKR